jgi:hypothetical protein
MASIIRAITSPSRPSPSKPVSSAWSGRRASGGGYSRALPPAAEACAGERGGGGYPFGLPLSVEARAGERGGGGYPFGPPLTVEARAGERGGGGYSLGPPNPAEAAKSMRAGRIALAAIELLERGSRAQQKGQVLFSLNQRFKQAGCMTLRHTLQLEPDSCTLSKQKQVSLCRSSM